MSEFLAGCNRFGIDNPCPIVTKRLSTCGNDQNILVMFEKAAKEFDKKEKEKDLERNNG